MVYTTYDEMRDELREDMEKCLEKAKELVMGKGIWGYEDTRKGYAMDVYMAINDALEKI